MASKASIIFTSHGFKTESIYACQPRLDHSDRDARDWMSFLYPAVDKEGKVTGMDKSSMDIFLSFVSEGYVEAKSATPVVVQSSTQDQKVLARIRKSFSKDIRDCLVLSKAGHLEFPIPGEKEPFRLTLDAVVETFEKLSKGVKPTGSTGAGNRRWLILQLANPVRIAMGLKPITTWRRELRSYDNDTERQKDHIRLNEDETTGKKKTTTQEKIVSAFKLAKKGVPESAFTPVFIKRGVVQFMATLTKLVAYVCFGNKVYGEKLMNDIVSGVLSLTQSHLKALRALRMACEHSDFSPKENVPTFLGTARKPDAVRVKANILENPEKTSGAAIQWFDKVRDPAFKPPARVQGLPREQVINIATKLDDDDPRSKLLKCIANNDAEGVIKVLDDLAPAVYWRNKAGDLDGEALTQLDVDKSQAGKPGYAKKKGSGRSRKTG
ncbi:hypothetical protein LCGC14_0814670 [marine sediment metagenome]|uniref:Uncharacterized protein n=1 Tax=marine sediment metagenome TaxID=412755 RepID=A0A0F9S5K8_9ZZZZ